MVYIRPSIQFYMNNAQDFSVLVFPWDRLYYAFCLAKLANPILKWFFKTNKTKINLKIVCITVQQYTGRPI